VSNPKPKSPREPIMFGNSNPPSLTNPEKENGNGIKSSHNKPHYMVATINSSHNKKKDSHCQSNHANSNHHNKPLINNQTETSIQKDSFMDKIVNKHVEEFKVNYNEDEYKKLDFDKHCLH